MRPYILIVDQEPRQSEKLYASLDGLFHVSIFQEVDAALEGLHAHAYELLILDENTLTAQGLGIHQIKSNNNLAKKIPSIILSEEQEGPSLIGDLDSASDHYLKKPVSSNSLHELISYSLSYAVEVSWAELPRASERALKSSVREFQNISQAIETGEPLDIKAAHESCKSLVKCILTDHYKPVLEAVRDHHNYTYAHSFRVGMFLAIFGKSTGMSEDEMQMLSTGGLLHDVGKMATPQEILNKPSKLNDEEWAIMKSHVDHTREILNSMPEVNASIRVIAEQHHEKLDGSGYPLGLKGSQLNELARMSSIVDIYGALTDKRSYKPAFSEEKSFSILEDMGPALDQRLVSIFREVLTFG